MAAKGSFNDLNDFLQKLSSSSALKSSDFSKAKLQTIKEILYSLQQLNKGAKASNIINVIHQVERGNHQGLSSDLLSAALEECRCLTSCTLNQDHNHDESRQTSGFKDDQYRGTSSRNGDDKSRDVYPPNHRGHHTMESSIYRRKQEQDRNRADMEREIQELRTRLSSVVGDKLTAGNTSLADLSDPNRPTSIAEQYRELYNDVWANALEELTAKPGIKEKTAVIELGDILKTTCEMTKHLSKESEKSMVKTIKESLHTIGDPRNTPPSGHDTDNTGTISAHVKALRRENVEMSIPKVQEKCCKKMNNTDKRSSIYIYIKQCARLTWLMNIQDPPLVLKWAKEGEPLQSQYFSEYTSRGTTVDYTAWPALLIQENGAILAKGIAQPKRK